MSGLLGIYREHECSPGRHRSNDARLLEMVADALRVEGFDVELTSFEHAAAHRESAELVFSMCQGRPALEALAAWERGGAVIVNSPRASLNTHRDRLPALMIDAGIPFPETRLVSTADAPAIAAAARTRAARTRPGSRVDVDSAAGILWLKRGDVHATVAADVQRVDSPGALAAGLEEFAARGVRLAAVQAHRPGDEIKFYGVAEGSFFHWFYQREAHGYRFDPAELVRIAEQAAALAGLDIFGGDVIVSPAGELTLIDLNDWPSFAPCRDAAAGAIAGFLTRRVHALRYPDLIRRTNPSAV
jgi:hypothetical protein